MSGVVNGRMEMYNLRIQMLLTFELNRTISEIICKSRNIVLISVEENIQYWKNARTGKNPIQKQSPIHPRIFIWFRRCASNVLSCY